MASQSLSSASQAPTFATLATVEGQFFNGEIMCRLIHFWEARHFKLGNTLMGFELLLIDSEGNTIQGFISANRLFRYEKHLKANDVYKLKKFMIKAAKTRYMTTDHTMNILFTDQTTMVKVPEGAENIAQQKFRTRNFNDFSAIADAETHLFDVIGHIRHVTGDNLRTHTPGSNPIEVVGNGAKNHVFLHLLMTDGETVRVYLWGNIAENFRQRWNESAVRPIALLITTVNPKTLGGAVNLSSTSASRLFFDKDDAEIEKFLAWLSTGSVPPITPSSSAITKLETLTINELHQFLQHETPQTASFYCFATILDVLDQYGWNYISCSGCKTKLAKTETSLYCTTCKKTNNIGLLRYRFEIAVRDGNNDGATFVVFDGDGIKLAGRRAADLLNEPHQADPDNGNGRITTPLPESLKNIVGRTCKFQITVKPYNFTATRQTFTVSRIVDEAAEMQPLEELNNVEEVKEEDDIVEQNNVEHNNVEEVKEKDDIADKKGKGRCPTADDTDAEAKTAFVAGPPMPTPDSTAKPKDKRPRLGT